MARAVGIALVLAFLLPALGYACSPDSIGVGVAAADTVFIVFDCRTWGETFWAEDTVITAITVWRTATPQVSVAPMHLYVTKVDPQGMPDSENGILLNGPSFVPPGSINGQPEEVRFTLSPPLILPERGTYYFGIKEDIGAGFTLLASKQDPYPHGQAWRTGPDVYCVLGLPSVTRSYVDLCFSIEFCNQTTGTRHGSWGAVKASYR